MSAVNVMILEDHELEAEMLAEVLTDSGFHVHGVAATFSQALTMVRDKEIDIVIIDVFLNGHPEGVTFAETICATPEINKPFVFLTSSKDRQIFERAKLTRPHAFLLKPFNELEVLYAIEMAIERFHRSEEDSDETMMGEDHLFIKKNGTLKKVRFADVSHIEVEEKRYCNIYTPDERFVVLTSLSKMESLLKQHDFLRIHRNFLVNRSKITEIIPGENTVILEGGISVSMGDSYKRILKDFNTLS